MARIMKATKWRKLLCVLLASWSPVLLLAQTAPLDSPHNPHVPPGRGPWFEGWYVRVTDVGGDRSLAIICATHLPAGQAYDPNAELPGYLNVLTSEGNGAPTVSYVAFPQRTYRTVKGAPVSEGSDRSAPADFEWRAEGYGTVTEDSVDVRIPGVVDVKIGTRNRLPWNPRIPELGPEGYLVYAPLPLHWHVHSLGSDADYEYTVHSGATPRTVAGSGYAHLEKNWQQEFPEAWVWAQGVAPDNEAQFVFSTANVTLSAGSSFSPWIVGYRSPRLSWDLRFWNPDSTVRTTIDAGTGLFVMIAQDRFRKLRLIAYAPPGTYGSEAIPTVDGFVADRGDVSFSAYALVSAYVRVPRKNGAELTWPIEHRVFRNAALEFGNDYARPDN